MKDAEIMEFKGKIPQDLLLLADPDINKINEYLKNSKNYIAEVNGQIAGTVITTPRENKSIEIVNISVYKQFQRKGIGSQLLKHVIHECKAQSFNSIYIATANSSFHQLSLYQKLGFRIISIEIDFFIKNYPKPIFENGIQCKDKIMLKKSFNED